MLNFKKLFLGLLFSVLFSLVPTPTVRAFVILKLGFLPSGPDTLARLLAVIGGVSVVPLPLSLRRASRGKKACCTALCLARSMQFSMLR